jgi:hypothetical protein
MATPLRKDQPEFNEEEGLTTADLAQGQRPVTEPRGPQAVTSGRGPESPAAAGHSMQHSQKADATEPLFPSNELESLRTRWKEIQTAFVDEPRKAVEQADGLVASAMKRLAEVFAQERSKLEQQWDRGDNVSTEDLRVALQRYRSFFDRLLSV